MWSLKFPFSFLPLSFDNQKDAVLPVMMRHTVFSVLEMEPGRSITQGHLQQHSKSEASLEYVRHCLKNQMQSNKYEVSQYYRG